MVEFIRNYRTRPWPKLEIPAMRRGHVLGLAIYVAALLTGCWWIYTRPLVHAENFLWLSLAIPILYLLKSSWVTIIGLLTFQVVAAFLFMGNQQYVIGFMVVLTGAILAFESPLLMYLILICVVWIAPSPFATAISSRRELAVAIALLVGWTFKEVLHQQYQNLRMNFPEYKLALLFILWATVGLIMWCVTPFPLAWSVLEITSTGILFLIITPLVVRAEKQLNLTLLTWICLGVALALSTLILPQSVTTPQEVESEWGYAAGAMGMHKNMAASFLVFSFFIILSCFYFVRGLFKRILLGIGSLVVVVAVIIQQSKTGAAALALGFIVFWLVDSFVIVRRRHLLLFLGRMLLLGTAVAVLLISIYIVHLEQYLGGYASLFLNPTASPTMETRKQLWNSAFSMMEQENHYFRGLGVAAFWALGGDYGVTYRGQDDPAYLLFQGLNPHSIYLDIFLHYGVPGTLLLLWLFFLLLRRSWKGFKQFHLLKYRYLSLGLFCSLTAFFFHGIFDFNTFFISHFWLIAGLIVALINIGTDVEGPVEAKTY